MSKLNSLCGRGFLAVAVVLGSIPLASAQQAPTPRAVETNSASKTAFDRATTLIGSGQIAEAATSLETALRADPNYPPTLQELAWIRSTSTDPKLRNPAEGLRLAQRLADEILYKERATLANWSKAFRVKSIYVVTVAYLAAGNLGQAELHAQLGLETATRLTETQPSEASTQLLSAVQKARVAIQSTNSPAPEAALKAAAAGCAAVEDVQRTTATAAASAPPVDMSQLPQVNVPLTQ